MNLTLTQVEGKALKMSEATNDARKGHADLRKLFKILPCFFYIYNSNNYYN